MGFFFSSTKKHISKDKFEKLRGHLAGYNFTEDEISKIEGILYIALNTERGMDRGIDESEIKNGIEWIRRHANILYISQEKIDILEKEMMEFL